MKTATKFMFFGLLLFPCNTSFAETPRTAFELSFIGKEWIATAGVIEEESLTDQCTYEGSSGLVTAAADGTQISDEDHSFADMECDGRHLILFQRLTPIDRASHKVKVLDAVLLPKFRKGEGFWLMGDCQLDGKINTSFFAIAKLRVPEKKVTWKTGIRAGWFFNTKLGKLEEINPRRLVCWRPTPP